MPWALVISCCIGMFAATASSSTRAPFLLEMATDFAVGLPAIANLFGLTAVVWGISSFLSGKGADRWGRQIFLVISPAGLATSLVATVIVEQYWSLVICIGFVSIFCGSFSTASMTEVSLRTDDQQRGRALSWVMSGQSLTLLIGIPLAAWIGGWIGWRGVQISVASVAIFAGILLAINANNNSKRPWGINKLGSSKQLTLRQALTAPVIRLFCSLVMERIGFGLATFYYPSFLRAIYDLEIEAIALPLAGFAVGNITGTFLGGQLADRFPFRRLSSAGMLLLSGSFALAWFLWTPGLVTTAFLGIGFSLFNALSRPPLMAALADVPTEVRGVIMGLNSSVASIGWLTASALGGWLYLVVGFKGFGPLTLFVCVMGALILLPDCRQRSNQLTVNE